MMVSFPRKIIPRRLLVLGLLAALGVGAGLMSMGPTSAPGNKPPPGALPVTVAPPAQRQASDWLEFTGQFAPVDYVELRARVSGYLTQIAFTDGQMVEKGDLLFVIDPRPYEIALVSARARLDQAGSSHVFAQRQLGRAGELRDKDFVSQSTLDQRVQENRGANAGVDAARAAVRDAELNLEFTRIVAPVSGRVSARNVSIGNLVSATGAGTSGTLLTTIVSQDPIYFTFDLSEPDFLALQRRTNGKLEENGAVNIPARVRLSDEGDWVHEGHIDFIDNQIDRGTGTIRARAVFTNPDHILAAGAFGRIRISTSDPHEALLVPDSAVVIDQSRKLLMTVTEDGTVVPKPVVLGQMFEGLRVVTQGIGPDDKIVINGLMRARPGGKVIAQPGKIEAEAGR